jgi:hypothetical protein
VPRTTHLSSAHTQVLGLDCRILLSCTCHVLRTIHVAISGGIRATQFSVGYCSCSNNGPVTIGSSRYYDRGEPLSTVGLSVFDDWTIRYNPYGGSASYRSALFEICGDAVNFPMQYEVTGCVDPSNCGVYVHMT